MSTQSDRARLVWPVAPNGERWTDWLFSFAFLRLAIVIAFVHEKLPYLFLNPRNLLEYMDDHQFYAWASSSTITLTRYRQLPMWNPYWCGGIPGIGEPENSFFAPDTLVAVLTDVGIARHLLPILGIILAAEGTYRVARTMGSSGLASFGAGMIFAINSTILPQWLGNGFHNFTFGFGLMPWVLFCLLQGVEKPAYRYLGGAIFAWIFLHAGTYPAPYTLMLVAFFTVAMAAMSAGERGAAWAKPFASAVGIGVLLALLGSVKLLPMLGFLGQNARTWTAIESFTAPQIIGYFTVVHVPVLLCAGLALLTRDRWASVCVLCAAVFFLLAMGDFDPSSPFRLLKNVPLLKSLRAPERHVIVVMLCLCLGAARFVTFVEDGVPKVFALILGARSPAELPTPVRLFVVAAGTLLAAATFGQRGAQILKEAAPSMGTGIYSFEAPRAYEQPFRQHRGNRRDGHVFPSLNAGSLACITGTSAQQSRLLRSDLAQEEYPLDATLATVRRVRWTPNEIELTVDARRATRVLVNQNHHRNWRASVGRVVSHEGLLAVDVPAGRSRLVLRYVDRPQQVGLVAATIGLLACFAMLLAYVVRWLRALVAPFGDDDAEPRPATTKSARSAPPSPPAPTADRVDSVGLSEPVAPVADAHDVASVSEFADKHAPAEATSTEPRATTDVADAPESQPAATSSDEPAPPTPAASDPSSSEESHGEHSSDSERSSDGDHRG